MKTHYLKILGEYANDIWKGKKTFEVRYNDRNYQIGDEIIFRVIVPTGAEIRHPITKKVYVINYILRKFIGLKENYIVMGINKLDSSKYCLHCGQAIDWSNSD